MSFALFVCGKANTNGHVKRNSEVERQFVLAMVSGSQHKLHILAKMESE